MKEFDNYIQQSKLDKAEHTIYLYQKGIEKFLEYFKLETIEDLSKIKPNDVVKYQVYLRSVVSNATANSYFRPLRAWFNWLVNMESIVSSPFNKVKDLKEEQKLPIFLSDDEVDAMMKVCDRITDKLIMALLLTTGMRRHELVCLKRKDIVDGRILINGKGGKQRSIILLPEVEGLLNEYLFDRKDNNEYAIISQKGCQYSGEGIRARIKALAKKAGLDPERIEKITPHKMRHTFATNLVGDGNDLRIIQEAMGHANINTTMSIYAHVKTSILDKALLKQRGIL